MVEGTERERVNTSNDFAWFEYAFLFLSSPLSKEYYKKTSMLIIIWAWQYKYARVCWERKKSIQKQTQRKEKILAVLFECFGNFIRRLKLCKLFVLSTVH